MNRLRLSPYIFCAVILPVLSVSAQIIKPAPDPSIEESVASGDIWGWTFKKWWWGNTLAQVRDKVLSEQGWSITKIDESDPGEKVLRVQADNGQAMLFFTFIQEAGEKDYLMRRVYAYPVKSPLAAEWDADLQKMPHDEQNSWWTEKLTRARIQRKYSSGWVVYVVEMHIEPKVESTRSK